jgi:hypothetical protein
MTSFWDDVYDSSGSFSWRCFYGHFEGLQKGPEVIPLWSVLSNHGQISNISNDFRISSETVSRDFYQIPTFIP